MKRRRQTDVENGIEVNISRPYLSEDEAGRTADII